MQLLSESSGALPSLYSPLSDLHAGGVLSGLAPASYICSLAQKLSVKYVYPWTVMISGFTMHGDALKSLNLFSQMLNDGVRPNEVTFLGVLSACCHGGREGHLEEAIEDMPTEPIPGVWGALFGACMLHKAYGLGAHIGEQLIRLQPDHGGRYALLANLYSTCQNLQAAARVRKLIKWKGVEKTPGQS
ncbi:pentatricopeptide repeat (PPR) superfamily protein [Actinidia rufa]|uniref:Pentatricopeptide repeat (PPR) superfamily protein n=1 Tax=Actinidia rufa TaxID=165716 RepID=A0A7J0GXZ2_9ERIC|nr:pentatricopeptide repeat (PPR) superfamily protein [Actinidia rufa]